MKLTPIHVPGKRRRRGEEEQPATQPNKPPSSDQHKKKKKTKANNVSTSNIERELPLEILERIFWFSENVNFPRSSLRFGLLLSGRPTLRETVTCAFGPTWDAWYGCIHYRDQGFEMFTPPELDRYTVQSYHGWQDDRDRFGGNPDFQSAILEYSWCDIDLILEAREVWVRRHGQGRPTDKNIRLYTSYRGGDKVKQEDEHVVSTMSETDRFYLDYKNFIEETIRHRKYRTKNIPSRLGVHPATRIPDALLTGEAWQRPHDPDYSDKSLQKLFWLVSSGASLAPDQTWETTVQGHRTALTLPSQMRHDGGNNNETKSSNVLRIADINLIAARLLIILDIYQHWPRFVWDEQGADMDVVFGLYETKSWKVIAAETHADMAWTKIYYIILGCIGRPLTFESLRETSRRAT